MLGRKQEINLQINQILDSCLIALAFLLCHSLRFYNPELFGANAEGIGNIPPLGDFFWLMAIIVPFTPVILEMQGYYDHVLQKSVWRSIRQLSRALLLVAVVIGGCVIFFKWGAQSRVVLALLVPIGGGFLLGKEWLVRRYIRAKVAKDRWCEQVLFAGGMGEMERLADQFDRVGEASIRAAEMIDLANRPVNDLIDALHRHSVERVIFAAGHLQFEKVQEAISACEAEGVEAWLSTDFFETSIARPNMDVLGGRIMMVFRSAPDASWGMVLKNIFDRIGALLMILLSSPLWVFAWVGIRLNSPGPVLFKQKRGGKNGAPFVMYKFRTMGIDAEERKKELEAENEMSGPVFKVDKDPRVFKFGNFLRRRSIDELPQLLNVLMGQMSLVGPRPLPTDEVARIERTSQRRRLSMKPGLTCFWQVSGRNSITSFEEWVELDLKYIDNWSIWLDIKILFSTIPAVLFRRGAK
jgi:exopolysaccharide biosynthesis polyprenyl glycosylphosphotransferase